MVQDFQAVYRVIDRELWVDDEYSAGTARPNLERKANELRVEASDIIRERIKQKEIDDDTIELFDPVSKLRTHIKPVDGHDNWVEMHKEQMIERILYEA